MSLALTRLNMRDVDVYGHGYGALVAARLAVKHPKRVRKVILDSPPHPSRSGWATARRLAASTVPAPWSLDVPYFQEHGSRFQPEVIDHALGVAMTVGMTRVRRDLLPVVQQLHFDHRLRAEIMNAMGEFDASRDFAELNKPALLLYGDHPPLDAQGVAWRDAMVQENSAVRLRRLANAGAMPMVEQPLRARDLVSDFLD